MPTPQQIQARLEAIELAIASGTTRVSYNGKSVEYASLAELRSIRDALKRELGLPVRTRRTVAGYSSGL
ncbi:phage head-tail joining protein [Chelatococcus reniformis]|uniref:Uncharacterized protein n=1 Tax=Chelatococcus reniformis TaxID=1494448 RepID=A0A916UCK9_9HYPH|nr:hypothetical protein [Chelatococcus reniformis]GGC68509.1 hypothetical protein GCM10010994_28870 [Chelatococcus reniformis]GGC70731.1 hypothetical protein GCM10010994_31610 [Chelatococcus reniformis]